MSPAGGSRTAKADSPAVPIEPRSACRLQPPRPTGSLPSGFRPAAAWLVPASGLRASTKRCRNPCNMPIAVGNAVQVIVLQAFPTSILAWKLPDQYPAGILVIVMCARSARLVPALVSTLGQWHVPLSLIDRMCRLTIDGHQVISILHRLSSWGVCIEEHHIMRINQVERQKPRLPFALKYWRLCA